MNELEMKKEIIQASINYIVIHIEDKREVIKNHPKEDVEFINMQEKQLASWVKKKEFAIKWRDELE